MQKRTRKGPCVRVYLLTTGTKEMPTPLALILCNHKISQASPDLVIYSFIIVINISGLIRTNRKCQLSVPKSGDKFCCKFFVSSVVFALKKSKSSNSVNI